MISAGSELARLARGLPRARRRPRPRARPPGAGPRQVRQRHGPARQPRPGARCWRWPAPAPRTPTSSWPAIWTHFATADELDSAYFDEQLDRFEEVAAAVKAEHPGVIAHAANSAAVLRDRRSHYDMARCGVAIYGLDPFQRDPAEHGLRAGAVAALLRRRRQALPRRAPAPATGASGRRRSTPGSGSIPLGYGDGVRRALTNNAEVLVGGRRRPLVGTVSMDNITIDLGPETEVEPGDEAVLIGRQGEEADPRRGGRRPARDDQLRGHLRDLAAGAAAAADMALCTDG